MAENSSAETVGKFGVGLGVGFALYFLIRNLGLGGGFGAGGGRGDDRGRGEDGQGEQTTREREEREAREVREREQLEQIARTEIERMKQLTPPSIPPDSKRLLFHVKSGREKSGPLLLLGGRGGQTYPLDVAIARVKLGKRNDVELLLPGDTRQGDIDTVLEGFRRAGIELYINEPRGVTGPRVSGNDRGQYGAGPGRGYR